MRKPDRPYDSTHGIFMILLGGWIGALLLWIPGDRVTKSIPTLDIQKIRPIVIGGSALLFGVTDFACYLYGGQSQEKRRNELKSSLEILKDRKK